MPIDLTQKARGIALGMMASADKLMAALDEFTAFLLEKEGAGIDWTNAAIVAMLEGDGQLKHISGATLNNAHTQATNIYNAMKNGGTLVANTDDVFQALRP
jgi:hypothetical protein